MDSVVFVFVFQAFASRINTDLANDVGNLLQRVLTFIYKQYDKTVPAPSEYSSKVKSTLIAISTASELIYALITILSDALHQSTAVLILILTHASNSCYEC